MIEWTTQKRKLTDLKTWEKNPRKITEEAFEKLKSRIQKRGFHDILKIDTNNNILSGNQRKRALEDLGVIEVDVRVPSRELTEEEKDAICLESNKNDGVWDFDILANSFEMTTLLEAGFEKYEIDFYPADDEKDDKIPETKKTTNVKKGDIYKLGRHRIICADSTQRDNYDQLFHDKKAKMVFSSPPYNMAGGMYESYKDDLKSEEYIKFNLTVIKNCMSYLKGFLFWNVSYNKNSRWEFLEICNRIVRETGLQFLELIVWDKGHALPITSKEMLTRRYEDIMLAGNESEVAQDLEFLTISRNYGGAFFNKKTDRGISNYWKVDTNKTQLDNHKACYPVALVVKGIMLMSQKDDIIFDPFLGSGTTLIGAQKTGRICYGIEQDPIYCQQIIDRYEDFTGLKAEKVV